MFTMRHPSCSDSECHSPGKPHCPFTAEWGPSFVVITAHGELDASNADQLADYVQGCAAHSSR